MKINKRIYYIIAAFSAIVLIAACEEDTGDVDQVSTEQRFFEVYIAANYPEVEPQSNGLYFLEHKAGVGNIPGPEDWVLVDHVCYTIPEDFIYETYLKNVAIDNHLHGTDTSALYGPYKMQNGSRNEGLTDGLMRMKEGGQATIFFTSDLGYGADGSGGFGAGQSVGPYISLKYEIELLEVIGDVKIYEQNRIDAYMDTIAVSDTINDTETDAFMYYIIDEATDGTPVAVDSLVEIAYKGYLMDGRVFDQKTTDNPYEFIVGAVDFIPGWNLGLLRLKEGEKARFVIPWEMAYGELGNRTQSGLRAIPPYETLLFDIEIISVAENDGDEGPDVPE